MADETEETPAQRIAAAVKGRPAKGYSEVFAADVVAVAGEIPAAKHNTITAALRDGAAAALAGTRVPADQFTVHQPTGQLAHLLAVAEAARESPDPAPKGA